jgi:hypothetical protein
MRAIEGNKQDVGVRSFRCVKKNDGAAHPFEIVSGGDDVPTTITMIDEKTGAPIAQVLTYEPEELFA